MGNPFEKSPELIPTKEGVLDLVSHYLENAVVVRELSDDAGLYFLEAEAPGDVPGETVRYQYMRKGNHAGLNFKGDAESTGTTLSAEYYQDGKFFAAEHVAEYHQEIAEWQDVK